jgi:hypothetical protein
MDDFGKTLCWSPANPLGGTVRSYKLRLLLFESLQPLEQFVVLSVGDFGVVFDVIKFFVPPNLLTQFLDLFTD